MTTAKLLLDIEGYKSRGLIEGTMVKVVGKSDGSLYWVRPPLGGDSVGVFKYEIEFVADEEMEEESGDNA